MAYATSHHPPALAHDPSQSGVVAMPTASPTLIHDISAIACTIDGRRGTEIAMCVLRDDALAAQACPYDRYDVLGWHNRVGVSLLTDRPGSWWRFDPNLGGFAPLPYGDGAAVDLGHASHAAFWRFVPDEPGPVTIWAYLYVNGAFAALDEMMASRWTIDSNGAARFVASV